MNLLIVIDLRLFILYDRLDEVLGFNKFLNENIFNFRGSVIEFIIF